MYKAIYYKYHEKNNTILTKKEFSSKSPIELEYLLQLDYFSNKSKLILSYDGKLYEAILKKNINKSLIDRFDTSPLKNILNNLNFNNPNDYTFLRYYDGYLNKHYKFDYIGSLYVKSIIDGYTLIEPMYFKYNDLFMERIIYFPYDVNEKIPECEQINKNYFKLNNGDKKFKNIEDYYKSIYHMSFKKPEFYKKPDGEILYEGHNLIKHDDKTYDLYCIYK